MFQLNQVACAYEQKKVFTGLDLEKTGLGNQVLSVY